MTGRDDSLRVALGRVAEPVAVTLTRGEWSEVRFALQEAIQKRQGIIARRSTSTVTREQYGRSIARLAAHMDTIAEAVNTTDGGQNA